MIGKHAQRLAAARGFVWQIIASARPPVASFRLPGSPQSDRNADYGIR